MINILRKRISGIKGMTLTELLVASILVGIVMLGTVSFGVAIRQMQGSTSKSTILSMKVKNAMARLSNDASLAVGDATDRGVRHRANGQDRTICFRHDQTDPSSYADDTWVCYYKQKQGQDYILWRCNEPTPLAWVAPSSMNRCNNGGTSDRLLYLDRNSNTFFNVVNDSPAQFEYIDLNLVSLYDPSQAMHAIENPRYQINTRISPAAHSR